MSSRYPPLSGFNSRDRSPQRFGDRRPPAGPRGADDGNLPPLGREPPRGPKALIDPPRGAPFAGRGRGYPPRGDFRDRDRDPRDRDRDRDRDFRDLRDGPPPFRRDIDRDWGRRDRDFDPRESRIGFGRGRSRSPPPPRDFRDMREPLGRDPDLVRMRRGSRDSLISVSSNAPDVPPASSGHHPRSGPMRGRGRGDWDIGRGRGRAPYLDDRDSFRRRSRSRDGRWDPRDRDRDRERVVDRDRERDRIMDRDRDRERERERDRERDRERGLDRERDLDRRDRERDREVMDRRDRFDRRDDLDRRPEREERERPADLWKRDRPPSRNENRIPSTSSAASLPPAPHVPAPASDKIPDPSPAEPPRKPSIAEVRRDSERSDASVARPDAVKDFGPPVKRSPPPAAPQVPAFGSVTAPIPDLSIDKAPSDTAPATSFGLKPEKDTKEQHESTPRTTVQPPTGPKAARAHLPPPAEPPRPRREEGRHDDGPEVADRMDTGPRSSKSTMVPLFSSLKTAELSPPTAPAAMTAKDSFEANLETSPTSRSAAGPPAAEFGRGPAGARATSPNTLTSPRMHSSSIPTGPRALQQRPAAPRGPPPKSNKQWVRPGYPRPPTGPSSATPLRRDSVDGKERTLSIGEEFKRERQMSIDDNSTGPEAGEILPDKDVADVKPHSSPEPRKLINDRDVTSPHVPAKEHAPEKPGADKTGDLIPDFAGSSDEDEDETSVFTQEYLEERKRIFEKDMQTLRSEMPPSPLEDPNITTLLMRIQFLGIVANELAVVDKAPTSPALVEKVEPAEGGDSTLREPKQEKDGEAQEPSTKLVLDSLPTADSMSIDNLPFIQSGPLTPLSDLDVYQENNTTHELLKEVIRGDLIQWRHQVSKKNDVLREQYLSYYKPWRLNVHELDRAKEKPAVTPGPTTPPAPPAPVTPMTTAEARRYKGNSELDFQNALRASEISAQEELERRRGNKATAQPDLGREAEIPDMLEPREVKAQIYKDTNNIVAAADAMDTFKFLPPPNDFTASEHEIFTDAFMAYPKKWGKIAETLPGRDFKQCIVHYYLTKEEIKYKAKLNKRWSRRGRARRSARPKSNALMADLGVVKPDYEGDEEPAPVTDTGRPRRAAAPTFGDSSADTEHNANGRRGNAAKDGGDQAEKPSRRGARTGPGSRGGRRGKAAQQQQQQQQTPQPTPPEPVIQATTAPGVLTPGGPIPKSEAPEPSLDGTLEVRTRDVSEQEPREPIPRAKSGRGRQKEGMLVFESTEQDTPPSTTPATASSTTTTTRQPEVGYGSLQPTSYWSVPEQRDFPQLLAHFGRDFEGISNFMKTKTTVMVKNYFQRRIDSGQKDFEDIIASAESKKARGEHTGPLPIPNPASKRRYEATPSSIIMPRPLAPHTDTASEAEDSRAGPKPKHGPQSSQTVSMHSRTGSEKERTASRYLPLAQASSGPMAPGTMLSEDNSRAIRPQPGLQPRMPGPRAGYFTEERREIPAVLSHATSRPQETTMPPRQTPLPASELARMDPLHAQAFRTSNLDAHGSPIVPTQGVMPSSQGYMPPQSQPPLMPVASHSRQPSLTKNPGSPVAALHRQEQDLSPVRHDGMGQRPFYSLSGQHAGMSQPPPILSPPKEAPRMATESTEAPPQVPAKRSNIMSILNDEPEEPQPRKRFASDQASTPAMGTVSPSRPVYTGMPSVSHSASSSRQEEPPFSASQSKSLYAQQSPYLPPSRPYSDYPSYNPAPGSSAPPATNDWMARFDPRGQQQPQAPPPPPQQSTSRASTSLAPQPSYSPYVSGQSLPGPSLQNLTAPSPAPTPSPAPSQRPPYHTSVYAPSPASHAQAAAAGSRDVGAQNPMFRPSIASPTPRNSSIAYGSRQGPPTPIQSPANLLSMTPRAPAPASYASPGPATPVPSHLSGHQYASGPQSYQQHVQTLVSGAHQPPTHRSSLGMGGGQYGHSTPPPPAQVSRAAGLPGPPQPSYTPPTMFQPNAPGGMSYGASGPPPAAGSVPPLHTRPVPGSMGDGVSGPHGTPSHHRVYSQGSNAGPPHPSR